MQTVVETPSYLAAADRLFSPDERMAIERHYFSEHNDQIKNLYDFTYALRAHKAGDEVEVQVLQHLRAT